MIHNLLMDEVWNRVIAELKRRGVAYPQAWLARHFGIEDGAVTNWKNRGIPKGRQMELAELFGWTPKQMKGEGLPPKPPSEGIKASFPGAGGQVLAYAGRPRSQSRVPVVGTAKLGEDGYYTELEHPVGHGDGYVEAYSSDENAYALRVKGDSMHPTIRHGQVVVIEPNGRCVPGEPVLVALHDGRRMVKELVTERSDSITVVSVNGGQRLTLDRLTVEFMHPVAAVYSASKWVLE